MKGGSRNLNTHIIVYRRAGLLLVRTQSLRCGLNSIAGSRLEHWAALHSFTSQGSNDADTKALWSRCDYWTSLGDVRHIRLEGNEYFVSIQRLALLDFTGKQVPT